MRTKALLALAVFAAGALTSSAQIYSQNIVGYYNVPTPYTLNALCVSLKTGSNKANEVIPYAEGDNVQVWTGTHWVSYTMDSASGSGWVDESSNDVPLANLPTLGLGQGFFYGKNVAKTSITIVGEVSLSNTLNVPAGLTPVGSMLPVAGGVSSSAVACPIPDGSNVQLWTGTKWVSVTRDSASGTGWADENSNDTAEPSVAIGQGFFIGNNTGAPFTWTQTLTP